LLTTQGFELFKFLTSLICVPHDDPMRAGLSDIDHVPESLRAEIEHFFDVYKMPAPGKKTETFGFEGADAAMKVVEEARARHP
jgi:inorganic pyrophosphatase